MPSTVRCMVMPPAPAAVSMKPALSSVVRSCRISSVADLLMISLSGPPVRCRGADGEHAQKGGGQAPDRPLVGRLDPGVLAGDDIKQGCPEAGLLFGLDTVVRVQMFSTAFNALPAETDGKDIRGRKIRVPIHGLIC